MRAYSAAHLSDSQVRQELNAKISKKRIDEAELLVLIAEADFRKLYLAEGYPSMHAYCIEYFHFSKDAAFKRIHAARAARAYPMLFEAVADGRLHLSAVRLLASHLTTENVDGLVAQATHKSCEEIEELLARRLVRLETLLDTPPPASADVVLMIPQQAARPVGGETASLGQLAAEPVVVGSAPKTKPRVQPEPAVWVALSKRAHEKLQYARTLLGRDASLVMERALDDLIAKAEKRKFAATANPRPPRESTRARCTPAHVRRAVWNRDGGQCTFVGEKGRRCSARENLEFDHVVPVARGGTASVENLRLRCRGHNQYTAEQDFGAAFMQRKREEARAARVADAPPVEHRFRDDVMAGLRSIGVTATEARLVVERSGALHQATLEESMRAALKCLGPRRRPPS